MAVVVAVVIQCHIGTLPGHTRLSTESGSHGEGGELAPKLAGQIGTNQEGARPDTEDAHPRKMVEEHAQGTLYNHCLAAMNSAPHGLGMGYQGTVAVAAVDGMMGMTGTQRDHMGTLPGHMVMVVAAVDGMSEPRVCLGLLQTVPGLFNCIYS